MFGGCPKWEKGKSLNAKPKLAETTVLEFGELCVDIMYCDYRYCVQIISTAGEESTLCNI